MGASFQTPRRIGILTGGGDVPGLNSVIKSVVYRGAENGIEVTGIRRGWEGLTHVNLDDPASRERYILPLDRENTRTIDRDGGTMLHTSRTNPSKMKKIPEFLAAGHSFPEKDGRVDMSAQVLKNLERLGLDALIAIGGDDTLSVAKKLFDMGVKVVGVPKTIDNDLAGTDFTFGFDTAVNIATGAIDRVHTTAEAHNRVIVVEVMGRDAGWIAAYSGIAGGADVILIPEVPFDIEQVAELIRQRHARGRYFSIVVAAEGAKFADGIEKHGGASVAGEGRDEFGHLKLGGIGATLAAEIEKLTGFESRSVVLGHIQRGGSPSAFDRVLATRYGLGAIDMVHREEWGRMAALRGNKIISIPLAEAIASNRKVDKEILDAAIGILDKLDYKVTKNS